MKRKLNRRNSRTAAFTLIELLVVIAIIALLIGILLPALSKAKNTAKDLLCSANTRSMATALTTYTADHKDWFPVLPAGINAANPNPTREYVIDNQSGFGGVAGMFSLLQIGDAEWSGSGPPSGDNGYFGSPFPGLPNNGIGYYPNGSNEPIMASYLDGLESLTCPRDKSDGWFGFPVAQPGNVRWANKIADKIPEPPSNPQDVISYNISYLYFAGFRAAEPGILFPPALWGDETDNYDVSTNAFWGGYKWWSDTPGNESQSVLDEVGFNPETGYADIDNHGDRGGYYAFADGHAEFVSKNPQRTFFANPKASFMNEEGRDLARREAKSINLVVPGRDRYMQTID